MERSENMKTIREIRGKKIFITGGAGFIGTSLVNRLIDNNTIVIYDNFHRNSLRNTDLAKHSNIEVIKGDVLDLEQLTKSVEGSNIVIHLAAIAGIDTVIRNPVTTMTVNMIGIYNILKVTATLNN